MPFWHNKWSFLISDYLFQDVAAHHDSSTKTDHLAADNELVQEDSSDEMDHQISGISILKSWCFISCCILYSLLLRIFYILNLISRPVVIFEHIGLSFSLTVTLDHFWKCMLSSIRNVTFIKMRKLTMFITAVCVLFLIKLRWPKNKSLYDTVASSLYTKIA